jgi:hypothetical protein
MSNQNLATITSQVTGVEISGGPRLLNFQKDFLGSNVDIPPRSHTMRLKTKMQNRLGQNLMKKALETNQIASCK